MQQSYKRPRPHPVSLSNSQLSPAYHESDDNLVPPTKRPFQRNKSRSQERFIDTDSDSLGNVQQDSVVITPLLKQEPCDDTQNISVSQPHDSFSNTQPLPTSLQLSHTQTSVDTGYSDTSQLETNLANEPGPNNSSIKIEPVTEAEVDLEITGVEMAEGSSDNWGQNVSGPVSYGPSDAGESSFDQGANQSGYGK